MKKEIIINDNQDIEDILQQIKIQNIDLSNNLIPINDLHRKLIDELIKFFMLYFQIESFQYNISSIINFVNEHPNIKELLNYYSIIVDKNTISSPKFTNIISNSFSVIPEYIFKINNDSLDKLCKDLFELNDILYKIVAQLQVTQKTTFAIPSTLYMLTLLPLFTGRADRIPKKLITMKNDDLNEDEKQKINLYLNSTFNRNTLIEMLPNGDSIENETVTAIITDNPRIKAVAQIDNSLFSENLEYAEKELALYINKTFGSEGIKHFLGYLVALEEYGRNGTFYWNVNEHLERLGYKRKSNGSFKPELKKNAIEIIKLLNSLFITATKVGDNTKSVEARKLFSIIGIKLEELNQEIINESIEIRAEDYWYKSAFDSDDNKSPQYSKLLRDVVKEHSKDHSLTLYLAPLLAVFWRINKENGYFELTVNNLLEWCNIDIKNDPTHKKVKLQDMEKEFNYMTEKKYIGKWECKNNTPLPSNSNNPFDIVLRFYAPDWLKNELDLITMKQENYLSKFNNFKLLKNIQIVTINELQNIIQNSGLKNKEFAEKIGCSASLLSLYLKGERNISKDMSIKIRDFANEINKN